MERHDWCRNGNHSVGFPAEWNPARSLHYSRCLHVCVPDKPIVSTHRWEGCKLFEYDAPLLPGVGLDLLYGLLHHQLLRRHHLVLLGSQPEPVPHYDVRFGHAGQTH